MAHKTLIYDVQKGFDEDGVLRPVRVVECVDPDEMLRHATEAITASGSIMAASIMPDWRLSDSLAGHLKNGNLLARWLEANPIGNSWIGALHEDIEEWNACGVHTPEDLEKYLLLQSFSDHYKEINGVRPRGTPVSMDMTLAEIEARLDGRETEADSMSPDF